MQVPSMWSILFILIIAQPATSQVSGETKHEQYQTKGYIILVDEQAGEYEGRTYAVLRDVVVPVGEELILFPGAKLFFAPNTQVIVNGTLVCNGTREQPILFTSLPNIDSSLNLGDTVSPLPWTGITLQTGSTIRMAHAAIEKSKFGVRASPGYKSAVFDTVAFRGNRNADFLVGDAIRRARSDTPVSFASQNGILPEFKQVSAISHSLPVKRKPYFTRKRLLTVGGFALVAGGSGLAAYVNHRRGYDYFEQANTFADPGSNALLQKSDAAFRARDRLGIAAAVLGAGFVVTITIPPGKIR